jgi:stearoyl-CoA desaturase (delta-9 desaturase)
MAFASLGALPFGAIEISLFAGLWLLTGIGVTVGYHRLFTHCTFKASPSLRRALAILGSMAGQGAPISWAALHRRHHEFSDREGDPHSPNLHGHTLLRRARGVIHSHFTWMSSHEYPSVAHYAPDLLRDPAVARLESSYMLFALLGLGLPAAIGGALHGSWQGALSGLLWGGFVRMFVLGNIVWAINSVLHTIGARAFETDDRSRNSALLALISLGESWHNNHHAFPGSANFGLAWYRLDPGFWCVRLFGIAGVAHDIHVPSAEAIARRDKGFRSPSESSQRARLQEKEG